MAEAGLSVRRGHKGYLGVGAGFLLAIVSSGCGGGSSGSGTISPPPSNVSVTISPTSATVGFGTTKQFTATVSGTTNAAVKWSVNGTTGGSTQTGAISSSGLYTAPAATSLSSINPPTNVPVSAGQSATANVQVPELNSINSVTVTATSQADTSQSASSTVTLSGLSIIALGSCTQSGTTLNCSAGSTGVGAARGSSTYLFLAGYGLVPGTSYSISQNGSVPDVVISSITNSNFTKTTDGIPAVYFQITVTPTATLGPRNVLVTNTGDELNSFPGGLLITP
jgi:hypothetical protein